MNTMTQMDIMSQFYNQDYLIKTPNGLHVKIQPYFHNTEVEIENRMKIHRLHLT